MSVKVRITDLEITKYKELFGLQTLPEYGDSFEYEGIKITNLT